MQGGKWCRERLQKEKVVEELLATTDKLIGQSEGWEGIKIVQQQRLKR